MARTNTAALTKLLQWISRKSVPILKSICGAHSHNKVTHRASNDFHWTHRSDCVLIRFKVMRFRSEINICVYKLCANISLNVLVSRRLRSVRFRTIDLRHCESSTLIVLSLCDHKLFLKCAANSLRWSGVLTAVHSMAHRNCTRTHRFLYAQIHQISQPHHQQIRLWSGVGCVYAALRGSV